MDKQTIQNGTSKLQWHDYIIIGIVLLISASIGIYYRFTGGRQQTTEEYFSADRSMKILPLGIAMTVSFISAITILGISAEIYVHGTMFTVLSLGFIVGAPIAMYCYLPVFFELKVISVFEYIERRFGIKIRLLASIANFCHMTLHTGIVLYAPSIALEATTGLSSTLSIILIGIICTFYSTIGGMKAVLISDVFQGLLMFLSTLCIVGIGSSILPNGIYDVWDRAMRGDRINLNVFTLDLTIRHTWWGLLFGGTCMFLTLFAVGQVQVQRLLTVKNLRASQMALILSAIIMFTLIMTTIFAGLVMYAVYMDCDPMKSGKISSTDKLMPYFVIDKLSYIPGFTGLFISGVFSASLSTISAMLNSLAALAIEDYIKPIYSKIGATFPKEKATLLGKLLAVLNGIVCISIALIAGKLGSLIEAVIGLIGIIGGPLLGIFTFGMFFESANEIGAIVGMIFTVITLGFISYGSKVTITTLPMSIDGCENGTLLMLNETIGLNSTISNNSDVPYINRISYSWYPVIGMLLTIIVGYLTSLITNNCIGNTRDCIDPNLFTPFIAARIKKRRQNEQRVTSSQMFVLEPSYRK
ncbi:putative sodium-dependent multivitamin transporter isoform X1 [Vespa mandarinia]|uniref:putative sodium-dependent multivitamin transporter isoform X1 n=2 Tax=Vespa mandarinia TaxID=7446 RepID=UPI00161B7A69|nr:putative sodium-dependent multivitamin transporter isoform X1 [Vespa mandarinia]